MKTKFRVALSMGHYPSSPGATRGNVTEYGLSSAVIGYLAYRLDKLGHEAWIIGADSNKNQVKEINKLNPDFGLELHFNNMATHPKWNGTEVLHSGSKKGHSLASNISSYTSEMLGTKNRGAVVGNYKLNKRKPIIEIIRKTICPFVVVEALFLSNDSDFEKIDTTLISVGILRGCLAYWEGL